MVDGGRITEDMQNLKMVIENLVILKLGRADYE